MVAVERFWVAIAMLIALAPEGSSADDASTHSQVSAQTATRAAQEMSAVCRDYWEGVLRARPTMATTLGDRRYDDRLENNSPQGLLDDQRRLETILKRVKAVPVDALSSVDRLTRAVLIEEVESELSSMKCHFEEWTVDPMNGPHLEFFNLPDLTRIETPKDADKYVTRCRAMGPYVDQHIANLKRGLASKRTSSIAGVQKSIDQLKSIEATPIADWALMSPAKVRRDAWSLRDRDRFTEKLTQAVTQVVAPSFKRYREFLEKEVLPVARSTEQPGLSWIPDGNECYQVRIRAQTSLDRTPEELHQLGLEEVAKFRRDLSALGQKALGTSDVATIQKMLREDPKMQFATAEEVEHKASESLERARKAIPEWFGILPKADCEVKVMGMHEAPQSTIAYYREPAADGTRPGYYMINTYKPETRPRYEAEALAFHEAIPGHHLQIAIAGELQDIPEFRKYSGVTAYVEGWALYTERLSDEMGLYSSDIDRIGMLSYDAWRACRLVVDTGIHQMGWSRQQAIDYMFENSVLARNNIENEVDRYIAWPAQALAYKCGQLEILALREEAKKRLGDKFDIRRFHDAVLKQRGGGAAGVEAADRDLDGVRRAGRRRDPTLANLALTCSGSSPTTCCRSSWWPALAGCSRGARGSTPSQSPHWRSTCWRRASCST